MHPLPPRFTLSLRRTPVTIGLVRVHPLHPHTTATFHHQAHLALAHNTVAATFLQLTKSHICQALPKHQVHAFEVKYLSLESKLAVQNLECGNL